MTATRADIREFQPRTHPNVTLGVLVARMRSAADEFDNCWREAIQLMAPTDASWGPPWDELGDVHGYKHDEEPV